MYVVIRRQLLLLRDEFRIPKLTFHSDLLHSSLEKIPLFTPQLCGLDIGPDTQIARSVLSAAAPARPIGAAACVYYAHIETPSAPRRHPITARCTAVGLLPLLREEFRLFKLILHSELRRRAASRRALPCPSSCRYYRCTESLSRRRRRHPDAKNHSQCLRPPCRPLLSTPKLRGRPTTVNVNTGHRHPPARSQ